MKITLELTEQQYAELNVALIELELLNSSDYRKFLSDDKFAHFTQTTKDAVKKIHDDRILKIERLKQVLSHKNIKVEDNG